jgi:8-oxo-dGTP pyrophosphatase MutT (NUDIX family)
MEKRESAGLAIVYQGKLLVAHTSGRNINTGWGIPKGGLEIGETPLQAAIRETYEEIGVKVKKHLINPTPRQFIVTSRKYKYTKVVTYFIVNIDNLKQIGLKDEVIDPKRLQLEEIDAAQFISLNSLKEMMMVSQQVVLTNLTNQGLLESKQEDSNLKKIRHFAGSFNDYINYWNGRITEDN